MMSKIIFFVCLITPNVAMFFGCCGAPQIQTCCQSWAYAPPRIIGYERIPLYAKVPVPVAAPPQYVMPPPPPPPPQAPIGYIQPPQGPIVGPNYLPQSPLINGGQVENGVEVTLNQINSNPMPLQAAASAAAAYESSGLIAPAARKLRKHKN